MFTYSSLLSAHRSECKHLVRTAQSVLKNYTLSASEECVLSGQQCEGTLSESRQLCVLKAHLSLADTSTSSSKCYLYPHRLAYLNRFHGISLRVLCSHTSKAFFFFAGKITFYLLVVSLYKSCDVIDRSARNLCICFTQ